MAETVHSKTFHYETALEWQARLRARAMLSELPPIELSPPTELGGEPGRWTPEQLLLSAVESCTLFTFLSEASRQGIALLSWESTAEGTVARGDDGRFQFVHLVVRPLIEVRTEADAERARALLQSVEGHCFIGSSLKAEPRIEGRVEVVPEVAPRGVTDLHEPAEGPSS